MKNNFFSQRRINPVYQTIFFKGKQSFPFLYKYFMLAIGMRGRDVHVNVILCYKFCNDITYVVAHNALSYQISPSHLSGDTHLQQKLYTLWQWFIIWHTEFF